MHVQIHKTPNITKFWPQLPINEVTPLKKYITQQNGQTFMHIIGTVINVSAVWTVLHIVGMCAYIGLDLVSCSTNTTLQQYIV